MSRRPSVPIIESYAGRALNPKTPPEMLVARLAEPDVDPIERRDLLRNPNLPLQAVFSEFDRIRQLGFSRERGHVIDAIEAVAANPSYSLWKLAGLRFFDWGPVTSQLAWAATQGFAYGADTPDRMGKSSAYSMAREVTNHCVDAVRSVVSSPAKSFRATLWGFSHAKRVQSVSFSDTVDQVLLNAIDANHRNELARRGRCIGEDELVWLWMKNNIEGALFWHQLAVDLSSFWRLPARPMPTAAVELLHHLRSIA